MATNKRLVLTGPKTIEIREDPIPQAPPKGLVIKVRGGFVKCYIKEKERHEIDSYIRIMSEL